MMRTCNMFLHIGNDEVIKSQSIIIIVNYQLAKETDQLASINRGKEIVELVNNEEQIKSIIITNEKVYYSPLSSTTLKKRDSLYMSIAKLDTFDYMNKLNEGE